eukprot:COSAG01_NODE_1516_length_10050_cov_7.042910_5_plen_70_part_00
MVGYTFRGLNSALFASQYSPLIRAAGGTGGTAGALQEGASRILELGLAGLARLPGWRRLARRWCRWSPP